MTRPVIETLGAARGGQDLIGQPFPALEFTRWLNTDDHQPLATTATVTLYRWWTESCPFCEATLPAVELLRTKYEARGLRVVAVYHPKPPRAVEDDVIATAAADRNYHGPIAVDAQWAALKKVWLDTGRRGATSVSFLVDQHGVIRFVHPGVIYFPSDKPEDAEANHDYELLDKAIHELLNAPAATKPAG